MSATQSNTPDKDFVGLYGVPIDNGHIFVTCLDEKHKLEWREFSREMIPDGDSLADLTPAINDFLAQLHGEDWSGQWVVYLELDHGMMLNYDRSWSCHFDRHGQMAQRLHPPPLESVPMLKLVSSNDI